MNARDFDLEMLLKSNIDIAKILKQFESYRSMAKERNARGTAVMKFFDSIIYIAIRQSGLNLSDFLLKSRNGKSYNLDLYVHYKDKLVLAIESKSYVDTAQFSRFILGSRTLKDESPGIECAMLGIEWAISEKALDKYPEEKKDVFVLLGNRNRTYSNTTTRTHRRIY
jgi:hypothetical protein